MIGRVYLIYRGNVYLFFVLCFVLLTHLVIEEVLKFICKTYDDDLDIHALQVETNVLKTILEDTEVNCFNDISKKVKQIGQAEKRKN